VFGQSIEEGRVIDRPDLLVSFAEINELTGMPTLKQLEKSFTGKDMSS
jgi:hypothetical protein